VYVYVLARYNALKGRLALLQARLQDVSTLLKHKNPSLLLQVGEWLLPHLTRQHTCPTLWWIQARAHVRMEVCVR
jgi:hypothetical protein